MLTPNLHVAAFQQKYPNVFRHLDEVRGKRLFGKSPDWCFCNPTEAFEALKGSTPSAETDSLMSDTLRLMALGAWRTTQGFYRIHPILAGELWTTSIHGELPIELFYRLPEWCVYVDFGSTVAGDIRLALWVIGFFVTVIPTHKGDHLLLAVDCVDGTIQVFVIPLQSGATVQETMENYRAAFPPTDSTKTVDDIRNVLEPMLSLILFLCSISAEYRGVGCDPNARPGNPAPKQTKRGLRLFPADKPRVWEAGYRLGAALQVAMLREIEAAKTTTAQGIHNPVQPHIRRAHWHAFWTGARSAPERKLILKWLPPIPVNIDDPEELVTTLRPVKNSVIDK